MSAQNRLGLPDLRTERPISFPVQHKQTEWGFSVSVAFAYHMRNRSWGSPWGLHLCDGSAERNGTKNSRAQETAPFGEGRRGSMTRETTRNIRGDRRTRYRRTGEGTGDAARRRRPRSAPLLLPRTRPCLLTGRQRSVLAKPPATWCCAVCRSFGGFRLVVWSQKTFFFESERGT